MNWIRSAVFFSSLAFAAAPLGAQERPDFSGVWRLNAAESQLIGGGGPPSDDRQVTWLVSHRDPEIAVVVNVHDPEGSREYSFSCTTDGRECVNELPTLREIRRMTAVWKDDVLVMSQRASTPHGEFEARDRLALADSGRQLVFDRIVINERGERNVRQVLRKLGPHPSQTPTATGVNSQPLTGMLILALCQREDGHGLITADLDPFERLRAGLAETYSYHRLTERIMTVAEHEVSSNPVLAEILEPSEIYWASARRVLAPRRKDDEDAALLIEAVIGLAHFPTGLADPDAPTGPERQRLRDAFRRYNQPCVSS